MEPEQVIILGLLGVLGWWIYRSQQPATSTGSSSSAPDPAAPSPAPAPSQPSPAYVPPAQPAQPNIFHPLAPGSTMTAHTVSSAGRAFIKQNEGFSLTRYGDAGGYSIGWGHHLPKGSSVTSIGYAQAGQYFDQDVSAAVAAINRLVRVALSQDQFDALTDFVYNVGVTQFARSQLLRTLNAGNYSGARDELMRWTHSQGALNQSLVARREAEQQMFAAGYAMA